MILIISIIPFRENLLAIGLKSGVWSRELLVRLLRPWSSHNVVHNLPTGGESHLKNVWFAKVWSGLVQSCEMSNLLHGENTEVSFYVC